MIIGGISSRKYTNDLSMNSKNNKYDYEIKSLQEQKNQVQNQIDKVKTGNENQQIKDQLISTLKDQIEQIDSQIQQKQMEESQQQNINTNSKDSRALSNSTTSGSDTSNDYLLLDMSASYKNIKEISGIRNSLKSSSAVLKEEANLDEERDKFHHAGKQIAEKRAKASEYIVRGNSIDYKISEQTSKINDDISKNTIKNNEHIDVKDKKPKNNNDTKSNNYNESNNSKDKNIDTLA